MLTCYWHRGPKPGNMGDILTPVILGLLGRPVTWAPARSADMLATGSIIGSARPGMAVWGTGAMTKTTHTHPAATYHAVRGPLTAEIVRRDGGVCPDVYGDPALFLPHVHDRPVEVRHEIGVVPHYVDHVEGVHTISPLRADPLEAVDDIRACERIVSSSLHGLVVAQAYGIPWAWVEFSDRLHGDGTKFRDFAASVGIEGLTPSTLDSPTFHLGTFDPGPLLEALP